jgi:hypothetical protein
LEGETVADWHPNAQGVDVQDGPLALVVAWRSGRRLRYGQVNITGPVAEDLRQQAVRFLAELEGRDARNFAPEGQLEPEEFYAIPIAEVVDAYGILDACRRGAELDLVAADQLRRRALVFYAVVIGVADDAVVFISKSNPARLAQQGFLFTSLREALTKISDPVFLFNPAFELAAFSEGVAVLDDQAFALLFRDTPQLRETVVRWIEEVAELLPMDDDDRAGLVARAQRDSRLQRRLRAISERGHLRAVSIDDILEELKRHDLPVERFVQDDRLSWEEADTSTLLKILNEDLFMGGLSGQRFWADRKSPGL